MENEVLNYYDVKMGQTVTHFTPWVPAVREESSGGVREINLHTKLFDDRRLFLLGEVNSEMANTFVAELLYLAQKNEPIDIYINSPGGSVEAGLVIYDVIQDCGNKIPINMYCIGMAASMGAVILAGGQKGRRFILPHSKCMIHEPLIAGGLGGSATEIKNSADSILKTKELLNNILAKHTGKTKKQVDKATAFDHFMTAEEAIEFGICDEIRSII